MNNFKLILFVEFIVIFLCVLFHIVSLILNEEFPLSLYPTTIIVILVVCLLSIYVFEPIFEWLTKN